MGIENFVGLHEHQDLMREALVLRSALSGFVYLTGKLG